MWLLVLPIFLPARQIAQLPSSVANREEIDNWSCVYCRALCKFAETAAFEEQSWGVGDPCIGKLPDSGWFGVSCENGVSCGGQRRGGETAPLPAPLPAPSFDVTPSEEQRRGWRQQRLKSREGAGKGAVTAM